MDITIYKPAGTTIDIIDGDPPVDQSATVAQLQADLATRTGERDALQTKIDNARTAAQAAKDADAANVEGQAVLDALA
jgi:hypothetical protein